MGLGWCVLAGFLVAPVAPYLNRSLGMAAGWILALLPVTLFAYLLGLADSVSAGSPVATSIDWVPSLGVRLAFRADGLGLLFALLISGIGALIVIYAGGYLAGHPHRGRFFSFILMFMGSMLGLVLADDILTLFVFWELTSITSFLLIGFDHERESARRAALQAVIVTGGGGLALLAGLLWLGLLSGTFELSTIIAGGSWKSDPGLFGVMLLILAGAFTKSAQVPFHSWLPNAMEAPTPVSAYLHSATMVKAGVYLVMRFNPLFADLDAWTLLLPLFGGATLITGALLALRETDLKLMLAYTTVASLGLLVLLVGLGSEAAAAAAIAYLVAHAFFKGALFMVAGAVDHEAGTRDILRLGGLRRAMPVTFAAAVLGALSMAGLPPFSGFVAKESIYEAVAGRDVPALAVTLVAVAGNALMIAVALAVAVKPFLGPRPAAVGKVHEAPASIWLGPLVLVIAGLACGIFIEVVDHALLAPATASITGVLHEPGLHLWAGIGPALVLSIATIAAGAAAYWSLNRLRAGIGGVLEAIGWGPDRGFDQAVRGLVIAASKLTRRIQTGRLEAYLTVTAIMLAGTLLVPLFAFGELPSVPRWPDLRLIEWGVILLALGGLVAVLSARRRLTAIVSLGVQGFAVALLFMMFGAPDLSFTQLMVETLSVVILALVLTRLNLREVEHRPLGQILSDMTIAVGVGAGFCLLLMSATEIPFDARLSDYFSAYSYVAAHGRNIVNVIIVDFRGLDTLGEITVVLTAGLAILALVKLRARAALPQDGFSPAPELDSDPEPDTLRTPPERVKA